MEKYSVIFRQWMSFRGRLMERCGDESRGWGGTSRTTVLNAMLVMLSLASPGVTAALTAELVVLIAFAVGWFLSGAELEGREVFPLILGPALAMGVQSAAVRRLGIPGVATTYITGTLTGLAEGAIERLRPAVASAVSNDDSSGRVTPSARGLLLPADVWFAYGMGAVIVGILAVRWPSGVLSVPVAIVALVVATATVGFHRRR